MIVPYDDSFPELEETFSVNIKIHSSVNEAVKNFATVNTSSSQCNVTIIRNDHPFGVFQLMTNNQNITNAVLLTEPLNVSVQEEISLLNLYVVRVFGYEGIFYFIQLFLHCSHPIIVCSFYHKTISFFLNSYFLIFSCSIVG